MKRLSKLRVNKEKLVTSPEMKQVVSETTKKIDEIVPKKQFDFEKMVVEDIAKLWDEARIEAWSFYIKRELTQVQENAIIDAHNIWIDRKWAGINNYTNEEILQKTKILKEAWFNEAERRVLLEKWVCGKEFSNTIADNLSPEQLVEFEKLKLPENIRNTELDLNYYDTDIKLYWLKERLWLDKKASLQEIDLAYRLRMQEALDLYRKKWRENLLRIWNELVEDLKKLWVENPWLEIRKEIRRLKWLKKDDEIMIITGFEKANRAKIEEFWLKSSYQLSDVPFNSRKKYTNMRENVDSWLNIFGLDVKYATIIIEKKDFDFLVKNYEYDNYIKHSFDELDWKSWVTYYDSILWSRANWNWLDTQMLDFDYVLEAQALLNIEKRYNKIWEVGEIPESKRIWKLWKLKKQAIEQNSLKEYLKSWESNPNYEMMTWIQPFLEVQMFWKVWQNKEIFNIPRNLKTNK